MQPGEILPRLVVVAFAAIVLWYALRPRYVFVIRIQGGVARNTHGRVALSFVTEVEDVCREHEIRSGWVAGVQRGKRVTLAFSWSIPAATRQRLRNVWNLPR